jgi:hypothetical protein
LAYQKVEIALFLEQTALGFAFANIICFIVLYAKSIADH